MRRQTTLWTLAALSILASAMSAIPVFSADDQVNYTSDPYYSADPYYYPTYYPTARKDVSPFSGGVEGNINLSFGNTDVKTYGAAAFLDYRGDMFTTRMRAGYMQNTTDGVERMRRIDGLLRTGFNVTNNVDFFGLATYMQNPFKGLGSQVMLSPGLGIYAVNNESVSIRLAAGVGYMWETFTPEILGNRNFTLTQAGAGARFKISDVADLTDEFAYIAPFVQSTDWRMNNTAALTTAMTQHLALKFSYTVEYRHVPVSIHKTTDSFTTGALVLKI